MDARENDNVLFKFGSARQKRDAGWFLARKKRLYIEHIERFSMTVKKTHMDELRIKINELKNKSFEDGIYSSDEYDHCLSNLLLDDAKVYAKKIFSSFSNNMKQPKKVSTLAPVPHEISKKIKDESNEMLKEYLEILKNRYLSILEPRELNFENKYFEQQEVLCDDFLTEYIEHKKPILERHMQKLFGRLSYLHGYVDARKKIGKKNLPRDGQNEFFGALQDLLLRTSVLDLCVLIDEKANVNIDTLIQYIKGDCNRKKLKRRWCRIKETLDCKVMLQPATRDDIANASHSTDYQKTGEIEGFIRHNGKLYRNIKKGKKKLRHIRNKEIAHLDFDRTAYDSIDTDSITTFCEGTYQLLRKMYKIFFDNEWMDVPHCSPYHTGLGKVLERCQLQ